MNVFAAGPATALLFQGQQLIGVAKTLTDSSVDASISNEEIRAASGNLLFGKYFHTSNLNLTLTNAMFDMNYIAASLGVPVNVGGTVLMEESLVVSANNTVTLSETPVAFNGSLIGWYKQPTDTAWTIGTITDTAMAVSGVTVGSSVCVKYFYIDANSTYITANAQYVPSILHVVLLIDLFRGSGSGMTAAELSGAAKAGRLLIDIPQLQMDGAQNLALTATGAATTSLSGSALAVEDMTVCTSEPFYGTFTQQIFDAKWQDSVTGLAVDNAKIELNTAENETLVVYGLFGGMTAPRQLDNADLTFAIVEGTTNIATVGANTGVVTAVGTGSVTVSVSVTNGPATLEPGYAYVTVS